jgi:hypothetical protein
MTHHSAGEPVASGADMTKAIVSEERIVDTIVTIRGRRVVMASDLATLYGVPTHRLNEQVKRNRGRFPSDFCFRLTRTERDEVIANCDHLRALKFSPALPYAFTEYGAIMAANVLNSPRAVDVSVQVVRAFMSLRHVAVAYRDVIAKLDELEKRHDKQFKEVFDALRLLLREHDKAQKAQIGFR